MDTKELIHSAAVIASGLVPTHSVVPLTEGQIDIIARNSVTLAMKIETFARDAYKPVAHRPA
jgi:hypothetical protein